MTSAHAYLMLTEPYPVQIRDHWRTCTVERLRGLLTWSGVIARVLIDSPVGEYPRATRQGTDYPVGQYSTVLAGPELIEIMREGHVREVGETVTYDMGRPFVRAVETLMTERDRATAAGRADMRQWSKLLANSIPGKCAQKAGSWVRCPERDCPRQWGEEYESDGTGGRPTRYRWVMGFCWRWDEDRSGAGPHTSALAYLTAYMRIAMRAVRDACPPRSVISQDTDGIWVTDSALDALRRAGMLDRTGPGALRLTASVHSGEWWGPRHYRAGDTWVLAGLHGAAWDDTRQRLTWSSTAPLTARRDRSAPTTTTTVHHCTGIPGVHLHGRVRADGWIEPPIAGALPLIEQEMRA